MLFRFLALIAIPVITLQRHSKSYPSTGLLSPSTGLLSHQSLPGNDVLITILKTGGLYATINSANAQLGFVDLVFTNGITDANNSRSATALAKGLGMLGLIEAEITAWYFSYYILAREDITINLEARLSRCEFNATLTAVDVNALVTNTLFLLATFKAAINKLYYIVSVSGILKLEVIVSGLTTGNNGTIECVFTVQLASVYVLLPSLTVKSPTSSSTILATNSTPLSNITTALTPSNTQSTGEL